MTDDSARTAGPGFSTEPDHLEDLHAWQVLRPVLDEGPYLPWSTGSMRPAGLVRVCNEVLHGARRRVVECGSGVSTVVLARLLRSRGDHATVTSLEHDAGWADLVTDLLRRESLQQVGRVVHAPLEGHPPWYQRARLGELPEEVDLLVVDGPPAYAPGLGLRRLPALAALETRLAPGATVVLDDVVRPGEQAVIAEWQATTDWRFEIDGRCGVAVGRRRHERP